MSPTRSRYFLLLRRNAEDAMWALEFCAKRSDHCMQMAEECTDAERRRAWLDLAKEWVRLSEQVVASANGRFKRSKTLARRSSPQESAMRRHRKIALECFRLAQVIKEPDDRRQLLDLASKWLERAGDDVETLSLIAEVEALKGPAH